AQNRAGGDPKLSEVYSPVAPVVTPGKSPADAPSDAIILFDGKDLSKWKAKNGGDVAWTIENGAMTVKPGSGDITTKEGFGDCQFHIEWRAPTVVKGEGQGRGNSGIFLMSTYELQILDSYNNKTYSNGQAGSIYKQLVPLANANKAPGEWQTYDVIFRAPRFNENGILVDAARITVLHNGVLIQNNAAIWGGTQYIGIASYDKHENKLPIILQDHGDLVSFRNIWIRNL
ncbi:MAG: 3-keto-disaccharide hydrolase, partial [Flavitalea sp.]